MNTGYALDPSVGDQTEGEKHVGDLETVDKEKGRNVFETSKKRTGDKRKRQKNWDASDTDDYLGPWGKFVDEKTTMKPSEV